MRSKALALGLAAITLLASSPSVLAKQTTQTSGQWTAVEALPTGERLSVEMKNGKKLEGRLSAVSDTRLTLSEGKKMTGIDRDDIRKVYRVIGRSIAKSVGKNSLIGAGIGVGGGVAGGLILGSYEDISTSEVVGVFALIGAGAGAVAGALSGLIKGAKKKRVLIYESN